MDDVIVRLAGVSIKNFKNVTSGSLSFENNRREYKSSILGLYGQNGSGKTALIDAIAFLKHILCGREVPAGFADFINIDSEKAILEYEFDIQLPGGRFRVFYEVSLRKEENINERILKTLIFSTKGKNRIGKLIDTNTDDVFSPRSKLNLLVGKKKTTRIDLLAAKKYAKEYSRSFIFSHEFLTAVRLQTENNDKDLLLYAALLEALAKYGKEELFIVNTRNSGMISLDAQPFIFKYEDKSIGALGTVMLPLESPIVIPQKMLSMVGKIICNMNIVLEQIIPKLTIKIKELGTELIDDGQTGVRIQLMSAKNSKEIALKYESEGIKKIISILQLLIVVYNQSSITVAVDELDAGVFEYLLGELLRIISEKGKGQLIFTSHNLRPL